MITHLIALTIGYAAGSLVTLLVVLIGCYYDNDDDNNLSGAVPA